MGRFIRFARCERDLILGTSKESREFRVVHVVRDAAHGGVHRQPTVTAIEEETRLLALHLPDGCEHPVEQDARCGQIAPLGIVAREVILVADGQTVLDCQANSIVFRVAYFFTAAL